MFVKSWPFAIQGHNSNLSPCPYRFYLGAFSFLVHDLFAFIRSMTW